jgi:glycosyltransferase involved in cell wall biosynthesis
VAKLTAPASDPAWDPASDSACAFVIPGDLSLATGGYAYDRAVLTGLRGHGIAVAHVPLPGSYPNPSPADLVTTAAALADLPLDGPLLIDGLAYGAFPAELLAGIRQRIVALVHHPLGLETGLDPARAQDLINLETRALARAAHVIVTSQLTKRLLVADFAVPSRRITVAEPGTELAPRATGSGSPTLHLLAVGSLVPRKGYPVLIEALAGLQALAGPAAAPLAWRLTIAGSARDPAETALIELAIARHGLGRHITILGAVMTADLNRLYASADLFVMPSLFEGYGMVLAEAMARGLPIVCTTGGAAAETVPDGAALKVAPGSSDALRHALYRAMTDAGRRQQLAGHSWAAGQRLPTWDSTSRTIATVLQAIAIKGTFA